LDALFSLGLLLVLFLLIAPVFGIAAFARNGRLQRELAEQKRRADADALRLKALGEEVAALRAELGLAPRQASMQPEPGPAEAAERATAVEPKAAEVVSPSAPISTSPTEERPSPAVAPGPPAFEESLTSRWFVWLGAVALALGSVFLVKYSIERGWLGPAVRVLLGGALGLLLTFGGEALRRRPLQRAVAAIRPDYVPPALTSAGLFSLFASVYAAYELYALIPPLAAFLLLAAISFLAVVLAVLQGPFVALLGLVGGFATPALVAVTRPEAWALFPYLLVLSVAALVLVRAQGWWWLALATLAGAAFWPLAWFAGTWTAPDAVPVALYILSVAALFLLLRRGAGRSVEVATWRMGLRALGIPERVGWLGGLVAAVLMFVFVRMEQYGLPSWGACGALVLLFAAVAYREAAFDALVLIGAAQVLTLMAAWHLPRFVPPESALYSIAGRDYGSVPGPLVPPEIEPFLAVALAAAMLFGLGGFALIGRVRRPALWALTSAITPLGLLAIAYWRVVDFHIDLAWSAVALGLAGAYLAAATILRRQDDARRGLPLGIYAGATVAALGFAATMALQQAWLTVVLAMLLLALAWIHARLRLAALRPVALIVAVVVLVRLLFNPFVLDYVPATWAGVWPGTSWVLYGYGLPALCFGFAARSFRRERDDRLVRLLEAGALAFVALLLVFEIRHLVAGRLDSPEYGLLEQSLQGLAGLSLAYLCLLWYRRSGRVVADYGWRVLFVLATAQVLLGPVLLANPLWRGDAVGTWPVVNLLSLAYALPALIAGRYLIEFSGLALRRLAAACGVAALVLFFVYLSLEVRRAFQGPVLAGGPVGESELYSYSAVWLVYALGLLGAALWSRVTALRYASLALLVLTVVKVFLIDMSALAGLYRVASFLGLGLALVGIGYLYQHYVLPRPPVAKAEAGPS